MMNNMKYMDDIPPINDSTKYFRSRLRGNYCEDCGHVFEEVEIIFTPEQVAYNGDKITRYFCGTKCGYRGSPNADLSLDNE